MVEERHESVNGIADKVDPQWVESTNGGQVHEKDVFRPDQWPPFTLGPFGEGFADL